MVVLLVAGVTLAACGDDSDDRATPTSDGRATTTSGVDETSATGEPPTLAVATAEQRLELHPVTYCWEGIGSGKCVDGIPTDPLPDLGSTDQPIQLTFPLDGWSFTASFAPEAGGTAATSTAELLSEGTWKLPLAGPPGRYRVTLSGRGPEGDVATAFAVTTLVDGLAPAS